VLGSAEILPTRPGIDPFEDTRPMYTSSDSSSLQLTPLTSTSPSVIAPCVPPGLAISTHTPFDREPLHWSHTGISITVAATAVHAVSPIVAPSIGISPVTCAAKPLSSRSTSRGTVDTRVKRLYAHATAPMTPPPSPITV